MPRWQRYLHKFASGFMCLLFSGLGLLNLHLMIAEAHAGPDKARLFVSFLFVLFAGVAIKYQFFFLRTVISEFQYDGSTLQFRTLGTQEPQFLPLSDIASIRDWRGRGGNWDIACSSRTSREFISNSRSAIRSR